MSAAPEAAADEQRLEHPVMAAASPEELLARLLDEAFGQGAAGVEALYGYASAKMRGKLGALAVFRRAFGNELYAPLLEHDALEAGAPVVIGGSARAELVVVKAGETVFYQVGLVRDRSGPRAGLWTLSGVVREGVDL